MITVNDFFAHWVKERSIAKYGSNNGLAPTFPPWEVYQYSDQLLKHQPTNALKTIQKTHLYSTKPVYFANKTYDRRNHNFSGVSTTGLNATEIATAKKRYMLKI